MLTVKCTFTFRTMSKTVYFYGTPRYERENMINSHSPNFDPTWSHWKNFCKLHLFARSSAILPVHSSFIQASHAMRTMLHLCVVLAVCQVALSAQLPYGNPTNPSPFAGQPGAQANSPFNEQDQRVPQQNVQPMYPDQRGRAAQPVPGYSSQPPQQQPNQYQQMMQQQQQQQRPSGVYSSPVYMPFGMFSIPNCGI